jgi:hypothetical protein
MSVMVRRRRKPYEARTLGPCAFGDGDVYPPVAIFDQGGCIGLVCHPVCKRLAEARVKRRDIEDEQRAKGVAL